MAEAAPRCRACGAGLDHLVLDLGSQPLSNAYLPPEADLGAEPRYPLRPWVCEECWLVQLEEFVTPAEIFSDYAYFSSVSTSWLEHAKELADELIEAEGLGPGSLVVEVASNDGYLLRNFVAAGIPVLGVEPAANVAEEARRAGIRTESRFFGLAAAEQLVGEYGRADLVIGVNVLAHVPDLDDFVRGLAAILRPAGLLVLEFPHLLRLIDDRQFDTIYHEHFSYLSLGVVDRVLSERGLDVVGAQEVQTHGGSLRVFAQRSDTSDRTRSTDVDLLIDRERAAGLFGPARYDAFTSEVEKVRADLLAFLDDARGAGRRVVGYGAPAKGNTLLNYCGIGTDRMPFTVDLSPHKQGLLLPGSHLPIRAPGVLDDDPPEHLLILPWNLRDEIAAQMGHLRSHGTTFVVAIPELTVLD